MSAKRRREGSGRARRTGPRKPPPDDTGHEETLYREFVERGRPVVVRARSGERFRGLVEGFDATTISIRTESDGTIRLARSSLRSIEPD
jgi:hypothetical protein